MHRNVVILLVLLAAIAAYTMHDDNANAPVSSPAPVQQKPDVTAHPLAPDFSFTAIDGKKHSLSDFRGKTIVLNFWASWCAPCVIEFPDMLKSAAAHEDSTVFLFLSQDETEADMKKFVARFAKQIDSDNVYIALDKNKTVAQKQYQTFKLPETYIISEDLRITEKIIGMTDWPRKKF